MLTKGTLQKIIDRCEHVLAETQSELAKAKAGLKGLDRTYSIGDRFKSGGGKKLILASDRLNGIIIIELATGRRWSLDDIGGDFLTNDCITGDDLMELSSGCTCARYWDNRRKVHVNE